MESWTPSTKPKLIFESPDLCWWNQWSLWHYKSPISTLEWNLEWNMRDQTSRTDNTFNLHEGNALIFSLRATNIWEDEDLNRAHADHLIAYLRLNPIIKDIPFNSNDNTTDYLSGFWFSLKNPMCDELELLVEVYKFLHNYAYTRKPLKVTLAQPSITLDNPDRLYELDVRDTIVYHNTSLSKDNSNFYTRVFWRKNNPLSHHDAEILLRNLNSPLHTRMPHYWLEWKVGVKIHTDPKSISSNLGLFHLFQDDHYTGFISEVNLFHSFCLPMYLKVILTHKLFFMSEKDLFDLRGFCV